jgi:hypothetical protein
MQFRQSFAICLLFGSMLLLAISCSMHGKIEGTGSETYADSLTALSADSMKAEYSRMLRELHDVECQHLKIYGIGAQDTGYYAFRAAAFQAVLKNPDRMALGRYEGLYQSLAQLEVLMSEDEKNDYESLKIQIYAAGCMQ